MRRRMSRTELEKSRMPEEQGPILGSRFGWLVGIDASGSPLVDFEGSLSGPVAAQLATALEGRALQEAAARHQKVVLLFKNGDARRPFLMGLIQEPSPTPLFDELLANPTPVLRRPVEARVDGQRVTIEGQDEVVIRCGAASITLRRNGKVVIKGTQLETSATGTHRIKGGSVDIN